MIISEAEYLAHYGTPRKSGRYPWGSGGDNSTHRNPSFLDMVAKLESQGLTPSQVAKGMGLGSTTQLVVKKRLAKTAEKQDRINEIEKLAAKGMSNVEIGKQIGINESSVRLLRNPAAKVKADSIDNIANLLRENVDEGKYVDVGIGVERHIHASKEKLATAVGQLQEEGYQLHNVQYPQLGTGGNQKTTAKVLTPPGTSYTDVKNNLDNIHQVFGYVSKDGTGGFVPPLSIDSKRIAIRYGDEGGSSADGVLHVRPGVPDVSLGSNRYAQVRVKVDGTHYIKGMAVYKDDLPAGTDIVFNTNKKNTGNKLDALKPLSDDPDNPFGAVVNQIKIRDSNGKEHATSAMNLVNEAGDWESWSRSLSSQTLSKQAPKLAKQQLDMAYEKRKNSLDQINQLTNPAVKKKLLESYALEADSAAVHLKAAALPRSSWHVILPSSKLKETEIYAPNFKNGETVALVRYPHGGPFEIPELVVNNRHRESNRMIGRAVDAVVINSKVAERLSGADFDGDAVLVIPNSRRSIKTKPPLEELKGFDPRAQYPNPPGAPKMTPRTKGIEMGLISNLITDMTIRGANNEDLSRAIRHSMVVIDAENHNLDYRKSARDFNIRQLKEKYQEGPRGGAATLISRKKTEEKIPLRRLRRESEGGPINKETGKLEFVRTGESYVNKKGQTVLLTERVRSLAITDDAHTLVSGTKGTSIERVYADHSNRLKGLANQARKEYVRTPKTVYSESAARVYKPVVVELDRKLNVALKNAPLERQAQLVANTALEAKVRAHPDMSPEQKKKQQFIELTKARNRVGANKERIDITKDEWDAIQAGAISNNKLSQILNNTDIDKIKVLATPRRDLKMTSTKHNRAMSMLASGYTQAEVAEQLGVSLTTLKSSIAGQED